MSNNRKYAVWSNEHNAWWRGAQAGYTASRAEAGVYTREAALAICLAAIPGTAHRLGVLPEIPVAFEDLEEIARQYRSLYPSAPIDAWE
jgi:hypothetical protein